jgi:transcriptional regulator with XRE-family HTH domain
MSVLQNLKEIRKLQKGKLEHFARFLETSSQTLGRYESRKRKISLEMAEKYADMMGYELKLIKK